MKIIFKCSEQFNENLSLILDLDLNSLVSEVRNRISKNTDLPLSSFHLVTKKNNVKILLTDTWPLSFFIDDENPRIKIKLLELPAFARKDSLVNHSSIFGALQNIKFSYSLKPFDIAIIACRDGSLENLKQVIDAEYNTEDEIIHQVQDCQWGLLHYACVSGSSEIVSYLVKLRVNCNKVTIDEWTPLQLCCQFNHIQCARELLKHPSIQINKRTKYRGTALHLSCENGNIGIVKLLLEKNPAINIEDHKHKTPIEYVTVHEIFEILAIFTGECELRKSIEDEVLTPFCSEAYLVNSFSL